MSEAGWRIELLAGLRATHESRVVTRFRTRKTALLLAYLAYHLEQSHPRDTLHELLWPGSEPERGRNNLSKELTALRQLLEPPGVPSGAILRADRFTISLNPGAITTDAAQFEAAVRSAARGLTEAERRQQLADALELYRGEILPGFFEEWVLQERLRLAELYFQALRELVASLEQAGDAASALRYAHQAVRADPLREEAQRDLMRLLAACGQPESALRQHTLLAGLLARQWRAEPEEETEALVRELAQQIGRTAGGAETSAIPVPEVPAAAWPASLPRAAPSAPLPTGTLTFLLAEIGGSVLPGEGFGAGLPGPRASEYERLRPLLRGYGGVELGETGGTLRFAFGRASDALAAALAGQRALAERALPAGVAASPARIALHTAEVEPGEAIPASAALCRAARLLLAAHGGQVLLSETAVTLLRQDPSTPPSLTDLGRYRLLPGSPPERLFQADEPGATRPSFPPPNALPGPAGNLPPQFTRFFGREAEIEALVRMLGGIEPGDRPLPAAYRLVTLTGPGGSGKTRLALEAAARVEASYRGAVWFVPLADVVDVSQVPDKLLAALRVRRAPADDPLEQVAGVLHGQPALLVLDNVEHLAAEAAMLVQLLLERAPALTCLVTSRQRLRLDAEREFAVLPLPIPVESRELRVESPTRTGPSELSTLNSQLSTLTQCPSVRIFVDRAQAVRPDFQVTAANAPAVAELCRQLEGIPLAIELAAARAQVLTPKQMLAHLERRFELLVSRRRGADARHRSLRATLDWSFQLLSPELQRFLARLSVFRGGWSLDAAEQVCEQPQVVEALQQLCDGWMILADEREGEMRFRMLETMREYAREQLSAPEAAVLHRRHAAFCLGLAERGEERLRGRDQGDGRDQREWLEVLEREHDNMRAALAWSLKTVDSGPWLVDSSAEAEAMTDLFLSELTTHHHPLSTAAKIGLRLAGALQLFWQRRGHWAEGRAWLEAALSQARSMRRSLAHVKVLCALANLDWLQGHYGEARARANTALASAHKLCDRRWQAYAPPELDATLDAQGEFAPACAHWEQGLPLFREVGDQWGVALSLDMIAHARSSLGELEAARALWEESDPLFQQLGDVQALSWHRDRLAKAALQQGDPAAARAYYEESLAMRRAMGDKSQIVRSLMRLGSLALSARDLRAARAYYGESLDLQRELGDRPDMLLSLHALAKIALDQGDTSAAAAFSRERLLLAGGLRDGPAADDDVMM